MSQLKNKQLSYPLSGSFTGSFGGTFSGSFSGVATSASYALTASYWQGQGTVGSVNKIFYVSIPVIYFFQIPRYTCL
jgi:hypothetical protein